MVVPRTMVVPGHGTMMIHGTGGDMKTMLVSPNMMKMKMNHPQNLKIKQALKDAQQAERVAESLALEAQRAWSEAQGATQALRRDRGFGQSPPSKAQDLATFAVDPILLVNVLTVVTPTCPRVLPRVSLRGTI